MAPIVLESSPGLCLTVGAGKEVPLECWGWRWDAGGGAEARRARFGGGGRQGGSGGKEGLGGAGRRFGGTGWLGRLVSGGSDSDAFCFPVEFWHVRSAKLSIAQYMISSAPYSVKHIVGLPCPDKS